MMRPLPLSAIALATVTLIGCATSTVPPPSVATQGRIPREKPEYRQMAAYLAGKTGDAIKAPPDRDLTAKIQLEPTPGALQIRKRDGQYRGEVLTSGPYSDGYVALTTWVPVTRYFKILREVDCDTKMWVTLVTPSMIRSNPMYVSGISRDQDPSFGCEKHFHERFKDGNDPDLAGADGVVIDPTSFEDRGGHGPFVNQMHVFMRAWAIKFEEPTDAEIETRLKRRALKPIDILQLRAAAYWIEKHRATKFADLMRKRMPKPGSLEMLYGWDHGMLALAQTLASFEDPADNTLWISILKEGSGDRSGNPNHPLPVPSQRNDYALVAAHALACSGNRTYVDVVRQIAEHSPLLPHKLAAAQVLADVGRADWVRPIAERVVGGSQAAFLEAAQGKKTFMCPFKVTYG